MQRCVVSICDKAVVHAVGDFKYKCIWLCVRSHVTRSVAVHLLWDKESLCVHYSVNILLCTFLPLYMVPAMSVLQPTCLRSPQAAVPGGGTTAEKGM